MDKTSFRKKILPAATALMSLAVFAVSANILPAILLRAARDMGVNPAVFINLSAWQFMGFIPASFLGGTASDRFGKKYIFLTGALCTFGGAFGWANVQSVSTAALCAVIMGIGGGVIESIGSAVLTDLFPDKRRFYLSMSQVFYCIGAAAAPLVIGRLMPVLGSWRIFFIMLGSASGVLVLLAMCWENRKETQTRLFFHGLNKIALSPRFFIPCIVLFCYVFSETMVVIYSNYYLRVIKGAPEAWAIYANVFFWGAMGVGRICIAFVPERVEYEKMTIVLLFGSAVSFLLHLFNFNTGGNLWKFPILLFALTGFFYSAIWAQIVAMAAARFPDDNGAAVGSVIGCGACGCVAASPFVAFLVRTNSITAFFISGAVFLFISGAILMSEQTVTSFFKKKKYH